MKPILFNTEMVRAMLEDRKTVTRRVVKNADSRWNFDELELNPAMAKVRKDGTEYPVDMPGLWAIFEDTDGPIEYPMGKAPYRPGDILYVRETFHQTPNGQYWYKADNLCTGCTEDGFCLPEGVKFHATCKICEYYDGYQNIKWRPSIHMPREAARIFLRVMDVRVERLQDITELDILEKEGVTVDFPQPKPSYMSLAYTETRLKPAVRKAFADLWNSTIKKTDRALYGWEANPWVWVIGFERISKVDMLKEEAERGFE